MRMSQLLDDLGKESTANQNVTLQKLLERLGTRSHVIAILFLTIPFVQPIPMLGLSTIFGAAIITISITYMLGKPPWIPLRFRDREVPRGVMDTICQKGASVFRWLERFVRPRGRFLHAHPWMQTFAALCIVVCAVLLALPIPFPATNTIPAVPIVLLALGLLEEDGYFVLGGYLGVFLAVIFFALLFLGPLFGLTLLTDKPII